MIEVRNTLFQPLTFQLRDGAGLHLGPRERRRIQNDQLSAEIEKAAGRGMITLVRLPDEVANVQRADAISNTPEPAEADSSGTEPAGDQSPTTSRKRR